MSALELIKKVIKFQENKSIAPIKNIIVILNCQIYTICFLYWNFNRLWMEDYREWFI